MVKRQTDINKIGEVTFRRKYAEQLKGKKIHFPGEPSENQNKQIVKDRILDYTKYFNNLKMKGIRFTHYLEIGSGVGQGAMLLENKYGSSGFASDISYETLLLAPSYMKFLGYKKNAAPDSLRCI